MKIKKPKIRKSQVCNIPDLLIDINKIEGMRGFIPVFETLKEAEEHSQDGKYQIMEMSV